MDHQYPTYGHPVLGAFRTLRCIFLRVIGMVLRSHMIAEILRDRELSGRAKAGLLLSALALPFRGVCAYLVARGQHMVRRKNRHAEETGPGHRLRQRGGRRFQDPLRGPRQPLRPQGQRRNSPGRVPVRQ